METKCSKKKTIEIFKNIIGDMEENMRLLALDGWQASPYFTIFHPTPKQSYQAYLLFSKRLKRIRKNNRFEQASQEEETESFEQYMQDYEQNTRPIQPEAELHDLIGRLLFWFLRYRIIDDINCMIDIEADKSGADFIAQLLNMHYPLDEKEFTYFDFYNSDHLDDYVDPYPVWTILFQRMKAHGYALYDREEITNEVSQTAVEKAYQKVFGDKN